MKTVHTPSNIGNLILSDQPLDDFNNMMNQSLSEGGEFMIDMLKVPKRSNIPFQQQQNQFTANTENAQPASPKFSRANQQLFPRQTQERSNFSSLVQYFHLKTFLSKITWKRKMNSHFKQYHFEVLNDKASNLNLKLFHESAIKIRPMMMNHTLTKEQRMADFRRKLWNMMKQTLSKVYLVVEAQIEKVPLIHPDEKGKIVWDTVILVPRLYFMFSIPLDLSFTTKNFLYIDWFYGTLIMVLLLLIDVFVSLNTAFYEQGVIVQSRVKIGLFIISKSWGFELISVVMLCLGIFTSESELQMNVNDNAYQLVLLLFIVQFRNITKLIRELEEVLNLSKPVSSFLELMKLIVAVMYLLHVFACLWFWAGEYSHNHWRTSWLYQKEILHESWEIHYLYSFYYSTVTMFTIGYGDINPDSHLEIIISIMFMMICSIQLSYSVSTVGAIIDKISAYRQEQMKKMQTINCYMQKKKISYDLQYQIREYLNYFWQAENEEESNEEKTIIDQLSENLRSRLLLEANKNILNTCPLFKQCFSDSLKNNLVNKIHHVVIQPENNIDFSNLVSSKQGQIFICFIEKGQLEIFFENDNTKDRFNSAEVTVLSTVGPGNFIGLNSFVTGIHTREKFRSIGFTKLLLLSRSDFLKTLQDYPDDLEQFRAIYDQMIINKKFDVVQLRCFSCNSYQHKAIDCPLLHFIPDKEKIIKETCYPHSQNRNKFFERDDFKFQKDIDARKEWQSVQEGAEQFQNENWKWISFYEIEEEDKELKDLKEKELDLVGSMKSESHSILNIKRPSTMNLDSMISYSKKDHDHKPSFFQQSPLIFESGEFEIKVTKPVIRRRSAYVGETLRAIKLSQNNDIKRRFQKVVHKVISINRIQNRKKKIIQQQKVVIKNSSEDFPLHVQLQTVEKRINKLTGNPKVKLVQQDHENLDFVRLRLQMLQHKHLSTLDGLDQLKEYKIYFPESNMRLILLKNMDRFQDQKTQDLYKRLIKYMLYPQEYIEKYKRKHYEAKRTQTMLMITEDNTKDDTKLIKRTGQSKKGLRKNQIRPEL